MRHIILVAGLVLASRTPGFAQTASQGPLSVTVEADTITRLIPVEATGLAKAGPANLALTAFGNVVIIINGLRVTADTAVWRRETHEIELNGGSVRVHLPRNMAAFSILPRRGATRQ
jgi:hypothetical protein